MYHDQTIANASYFWFDDDDDDDDDDNGDDDDDDDDDYDDDDDDDGDGMLTIITGEMVKMQKQPRVLHKRWPRDYYTHWTEYIWLGFYSVNAFW